ncbi:MAG TPA: histidine phosphatase family protein [Polyangiaceae bacterium]|nr:histidine phosphatase family protein [Polyangiaceae bacterium]
MRRRITLLRHGHANEGSQDFERPLSASGRDAAQRAGHALARAGLLPDLVLASSAPRALATAELAAKAAGYSGSIQAERALYLASEPQYRRVLRRLPSRACSVWLVGHNPGLSELARELCGHGGALAPAEYASVELELAAWAEL